MKANNRVKGGSFLLSEVDASAVFTPEDCTEEHLMIANLSESFIDQEIDPYDDVLEAQDFTLLVKLVKKAGELGLLGASVPEEYGGTNLDRISSTLISEKMVRSSSYSLTIAAHIGIGTLPIVLFGTKEQKQKYLPHSVSGDQIFAYCLTEPSSGSDALNAKTTAVLSEDATHYILNGTKQFITNAAFADVFIVYAKVDGESFSTFIVEKKFKGVSTGAEEKKMGIKGSSTRQLFLEDVHVPTENVLGEVGKGHVIAFNILNLGRYSLAAGCVGSSKWTIELAVQYGSKRKQFKKTLTEFPLIQKKIADMTIYTYAAESMVFRTGGLMDATRKTLELNAEDHENEVIKGIAEYAIECSMNKVFATECLDFVADEGLQVHGGYGFIQEYKIERIYRDSRINRIFEGTNEINRLLIPNQLLRKALKGELPLIDAAKKLEQELVTYIPSKWDEGVPLLQEKAMLNSTKKIFLMVLGKAIQQFKQQLEEQQEILEIISNLAIQIYAMESVILRTKKAIGKEGIVRAKQKWNITAAFTQESFAKVEHMAKEAFVMMEDGDELKMTLAILKKLVRFNPRNLLPIKRQIAAAIIDSKKYVV
ncbi:acyl-CoA dehydrogenase family protein [Chengkuizengella sediminis]|uniref:acyl-CoA dehydrogenase family protein n=1 Tax=Chengkuizengella sediminis TaxID=1885917 RepID=UPI001389CFC9|nr:acyl-CoA dehydrogenase family protein [Chengkuizengella sediminis]NDI34750.1 acyl-CoA dehydrogenase [Chengkuizengella sediminis]